MPDPLDWANADDATLEALNTWGYSRARIQRAVFMLSNILKGSVKVTVTYGVADGRPTFWVWLVHDALKTAGAQFWLANYLYDPWSMQMMSRGEPSVLATYPPAELCDGTEFRVCGKISLPFVR